jgi:hypothetical protein
MKGPRRIFPSNYSEIIVNIDKLHMKATFDCKIKAIVQTNCDKKSTSPANFTSKHENALFSEKITVFSNPDLAKTLKITLLIVKSNTTKMVGVVNIDMESDPIAESGLEKYSLDKCPMPNVKLQMTYLINGKPVKKNIR